MLRFAVAVFVLLLSCDLRAEENDVFVGGYRVLYEPKGSIGVAGALNARFFRISSKEQFSTSLSWNRIGFDVSALSVAYKDDGNGSYVSLNAAMPIMATIIGFVVPQGGNDSVLTYWGLGPIGTLLLVPQLAANWHLRMDLKPKVIGVSIGPATDVWAGRKLWIRSEAQSELYVNVASVGLRSGVAYDVVDNFFKFYVGAARVF